jgi:hypothetical protein
MSNALLPDMANNNDKNGTPTPDQERAHNPGQGEMNKGQAKGVPTASNRDNKTGGKMPPDRDTSAQEQSTPNDVGDDKSPQRAPQPGTNNR